MLNAGKMRTGKKAGGQNGAGNEHGCAPGQPMVGSQKKLNSNNNAGKNMPLAVPEAPPSQGQKQAKHSFGQLRQQQPSQQQQQQQMQQQQMQQQQQLQQFQQQQHQLPQLQHRQQPRQQQPPQQQRRQEPRQPHTKSEAKKGRQVSSQWSQPVIEPNLPVSPHPASSHKKGPLPGAANQWYALSNRVHKHGTTIEMMYTGQTVPQAREQVDVRAIPGVTHVTMELPAGVLPNIRNSTPDMPSLMNAMDFFRFPEHHQPEPGIGPITTIQVIPKENNNSSSDKSHKSNNNLVDTIEVIPLSCIRAAPIKRNSMNVAFQSYSLMQLEVDESKSQPPGRLVLDADISPTYMLTTHQQLRLQAAIMQENVPLTDALLPIVEDLYDEQEKLNQAGLRLVPAPVPMPYGTMRFHYIDPPLFGHPHKSHDQQQSDGQLQQPEGTVPVSSTSPFIVEVPRGQVVRKKRSPPKPHRPNNFIDTSATIMALDKNGSYKAMLFSDWSKMKKSQHWK